MPRHPLYDAIPDAQVLLSLQPEQLAGVLLPILKRQGNAVHPYNFVNEFYQRDAIYPGGDRDQIGKALMEAFNWMQSAGLLATAVRDHSASGRFLTRRALEITDNEAFENFRRAAVFPKQLIHPQIADKAWLNFLSGDFETAVFQAFKLVEQAVRTACSYDAKMIGVDMMRAAFNSDRGPLTDRSLPPAEREALAHLFAGAIGSYKNPASHRTVEIRDAGEAGEMLMLATHLLRIVEFRSRSLQAQKQPQENDSFDA